MSSLPPRKFSSTSKDTKEAVSPLEILLQMGFPRHRALKALSATGYRSVQLASDWLLTHVNDAFLDTEEPREYIFYASPTGPLLAQLQDFWEKSKHISGWNGAHNSPPHITLVSFFKAPDEVTAQLTKAVKKAVEKVGEPPTCPLRLEPYVSPNFMGLFVSEEYAEYLKQLAMQYVKLVSPASTINLESHVKSLHITLAYHFDVATYDRLKELVNKLRPLENPYWELRLYSRDPRFNNYRVHKVDQSHKPAASDELELVNGDYIYIDPKEVDNSPDGWVYGTSWLTGLQGYLPLVYTHRTLESDAWTLHRAVAIGNYAVSDCQLTTERETPGEGATCARVASSPKSEMELETDPFKDWAHFWEKEQMLGISSMLGVEQKVDDEGERTPLLGNYTTEEINEPGRRWMFVMRHGERMDLVYGSWVPSCFDKFGSFTRKDLNMPVNLPNRAGGRDSFMKDTPLTRVGRLQAYLVGEGLRLAGVRVSHVYASAALRCVETAHEVLQGMQQGSDALKIRVEPGLFEYKMWHLNAHGLAPFMTPVELRGAGLNVDTSYTPYLNLDVTTPETIHEFFARCKFVYQSAYRDTVDKGGNILFVAHAPSLDLMVLSLRDIEEVEVEKPKGAVFNKLRKGFSTYMAQQYLMRVPYCAIGAMKDRPWQVVQPPCPPCMHTGSNRFDWKILRELEEIKISKGPKEDEY